LSNASTEKFYRRGRGGAHRTTGEASSGPLRPSAPPAVNHFPLKRTRWWVMVVAVASVWMAGCSDIFRSSYDYSQVRVTASDQNGEAVAGVRLTLYIGDLHLEYGVTGADGTYSFNFVPAGGYGIEAGAPPGYRLPAGALPYRIFEVEKGEEREVEFGFEALE
jgi:hypothetical protein